MSDTNRVRLAIAKTAASAIPIPDSAPPAGAQSLTQLRMTGTPNLASAPNTTTSNEIRPDREISDLILLGVEAGGDSGFEQSSGSQDDILEGVLFNVWSAVELQSITATAADTVTVTTGANFPVNTVVRVEGADSGDGAFVVTAQVVNVLTLDFLDGVGAPVFTGVNGTVKMAGVRVLAATGDLVVAAGLGTLTIGLDLSGVTFGVQGAGDWVQNTASPGGAFANLVNSGLFRISSVTATTVVLEMPNGITENFAVDLDLMVGERLVPGSISVPNSSFIVERSYTDQENEATPGRYTRELFVGMAINQFGEQLTPASIATSTATFFGFRSFARRQNNSAELYANANLQTIPFNAIPGTTPGLLTVGDNQVYNTASSVARIGRGGVDLVDPLITKNLVNELSLTINNNLRRRLAVGRFGTASLGLGELNVNGTLNTFFDDVSILEDVLTDGFRTDINFALKDGSGRGLLTDMPEVGFASGAPDVPGKNADVTIPIGYQALRDPVLGYTIKKQRYAFLA